MVLRYGASYCKAGRASRNFSPARTEVNGRWPAVVGTSRCSAALCSLAAVCCRSRPP